MFECLVFIVFGRNIKNGLYKCLCYYEFKEIMPSWLEYSSTAKFIMLQVIERVCW